MYSKGREDTIESKSTCAWRACWKPISIPSIEACNFGKHSNTMILFCLMFECCVPIITSNGRECSLETLMCLYEEDKVLHIKHILEGTWRGRKNIIVLARNEIRHCPPLDPMRITTEDLSILNKVKPLIDKVTLSYSVTIEYSLALENVLRVLLITFILAL